MVAPRALLTGAAQGRALYWGFSRCERAANNRGETMRWSHRDLANWRENLRRRDVTESAATAQLLPTGAALCVVVQRPALLRSAVLLLYAAERELGSRRDIATVLTVLKYHVMPARSIASLFICHPCRAHPPPFRFFLIFLCFFSSFL